MSNLIIYLILILAIAGALATGGYMYKSSKSKNNQAANTTNMNNNNNKKPPVASAVDGNTMPADGSQDPVSGQDEDTVQGALTVQEKLEMPEPDGMVINTSKSYAAVLNTSKGTIKIALNAAETPITVNNFVYLAQKGFYNDTTFHRVISGFMIQGGDPLGTGTGGPAYRFNDEDFSGSYTQGTVAMANSGPNTNGSQFFIMHADQDLSPAYVIFGHVTEGLDVVNAIATDEVRPTGERSTPVNPTVVNSVEIIEE